MAPVCQDAPLGTIGSQREQNRRSARGGLGVARPDSRRGPQRARTSMLRCRDWESSLTSNSSSQLLSTSALRPSTGINQHFHRKADGRSGPVMFQARHPPRLRSKRGEFECPVYFHPHFRSQMRRRQQGVAWRQIAGSSLVWRSAWAPPRCCRSSRFAVRERRKLSRPTRRRPGVQVGSSTDSPKWP